MESSIHWAALTDRGLLRSCQSSSTVRGMVVVALLVEYTVGKVAVRVCRFEFSGRRPITSGGMRCCEVIVKVDLIYDLYGCF